MLYLEHSWNDLQIFCLILSIMYMADQVQLFRLCAVTEL